MPEGQDMKGSAGKEHPAAKEKLEMEGFLYFPSSRFLEITQNLVNKEILLLKKCYRHINVTIFL